MADDEQLTVTLTPESERHGDYVEVTVVADDRSQATVKRRKSSSGLVRLHENGRITDEQFKASMKIAIVMEYIQRDASIKSSSIQARVDNSSGNRNNLLEGIERIRDEVTFSHWRRRLPTPKRLILDMLTVDRPLAATARVYRLSWARARMALVDALDLWIQLRDDADRLVDEDEVKSALYRILTLENGKSI